MTLLLDVAVSATVLFAAGWVATMCLGFASADVRRTVWRAVFVGVAALPILMSFDPPRAVVPSVSVAAAPAAVSAATRAAADVPWLLTIWAVGCAFVLGRLTAGLAEVWQWGRNAAPGAQADFSTSVVVPMTWGVLRPQILLPDEARTWSTEARDLVIRHEAAHVASRDWAWQLMARVVTAALWFHPLAWIADRRLRQEAERVADDAVLASGADPVGYADELIRVARMVSERPAAVAVVGMVGMVGSSALEHRVRHVLNGAARRRRASWIARASIAALVVALSVSVAALQERPVYRAGFVAGVQESPVYNVGDEGVTDPKVIEQVSPKYPKEALENKVQGDAVLEGVITEDGVMTDVRIVQPVEPSLDQAAIDAALQWRFEPGRRNDRPVRVRVTLDFSFTVR